MNCAFRQLLATATALMAAVTLWGNSAVKDAEKVFFTFANRKFSAAEAAAIAGVPVDSPQIRELLQKRLPIIGTITLCERSGIRLSQELTMQSLSEALLLLDQASTRKFQQQLSAESITVEQWLKRQSNKIELQLAEAVRRWYIKLHSSRRGITQEHISDYYYRHLPIFRRTLIDPESIWVFESTAEGKPKQAHALLLQGMSPTAVSKAVGALQLPPEELTELVRLHQKDQKALDKDFNILAAEKYLLLMSKNALSQIYLPLDEKLSKAIGNALYDAWARLMLAEALKKELSDSRLEFAEL